MERNFICRFFCHDFFTDHSETIEFRIVNCGRTYQLMRGVHVKTWVMPEFQFVSAHFDLRSTMISIFEQLRAIEIAFQFYPNLDPNAKLGETYLNAIDKFIYTHDHLRVGDSSSFDIYGNKGKLPNHAADWEFWRPLREQLEKSLGYPPTCDPYHWIELDTLMQAEEASQLHIML